MPIHRNCPRQSCGTAGNCEAGGFVNSAVCLENWISEWTSVQHWYISYVVAIVQSYEYCGHYFPVKVNKTAGAIF